MIVLLDSTPLWLLITPRETTETVRCRAWLTTLLAVHRVLVPEIVDYELRRELLRANSLRALRILDETIERTGYLALTTIAMRLAARFWAEARQRGIKAADDRALDVDMILAAQATTLGADGDTVTIATTNVRHLQAFTSAEHWSAVGPP